MNTKATAPNRNASSDDKTVDKADAKTAAAATETKAVAVNGLYVVADFDDAETGKTVTKGSALPESIAGDADRVERLKAAGVLSDKAPRPSPSAGQVPGGALSMTYEKADPAREGTGDVGGRVDNSDRKGAADVGGAGE